MKAANRIFETSVTTGTGTLTLDGAVTGFQAFSVLGVNAICPYFVEDGTDWEVGIGTVLTGPNRLQRDVVLGSSNSGSLVSWAAGTKNCRCGAPAELAFPTTSDRAADTPLGVEHRGASYRATGSYTQTFDAVASIGNSWHVAFRIESGVTVTFDPSGSEQIDGATTKVISGPNAGFIFCNGSAFYTIGFPRSANDLSVETAVDGANDYLRLWDATDSDENKITPDAFITAVQASAAEMEAGSATDVIVTPGIFNRHPSAAKAWVMHDAAGNMNASYNMTSVTDNGTGNFTENWATDFSGASYCPQITMKLTISSLSTRLVAQIGTSAQAAGTLQFTSVDDNITAQDAVSYFVSAHGDQ